MNQPELLWDAIRRSRLIALLAPSTAEECVAAYETLNPLGIVLEIALRTNTALEGMAAVRDRHPDAIFLAGTVMTPGQAEQAIKAGAAGIVSPDYFPAVVEVCVKQDVMCIPGGTADVGKQLALKAELYGCGLDKLRQRHPYQWVYKLFPAMADPSANLEMAAAWKAVYKDLTIVYTGGISAENVHRIIQSDPGAIVCGSALTRHAGDPRLMREEAGRWLAAIRPAKPVRSPSARPFKEASSSASAGAVVTFGEIMLRLSPPFGVRLGQSSRFEVTYGGAEANVAVALAQWGHESRFVTVLPNHAIGEAALHALRSYGVDTQYILWQGDRLGLYYLEHGAAQRPSKVIYDRTGSSICGVRPGQIDWTPVLNGATWLHVTGITPALSETAAATVFEALKAAKRTGLTVSMDLNYRAKLWSKERARAALTPMMEYVDVAIANEEDAASVFGVGEESFDARSGKINPEAYRGVAKELVDRFNLDLVAITLRESPSASENTWSACLHDGSEFIRSREYTIRVVDRVGAGDAFAAGLIHSLAAGKSRRDALEFAVAASCLKHTIRGDFNLATIEEIESLAAGDTAGRVRR